MRTISADASAHIHTGAFQIGHVLISDSLAGQHCRHQAASQIHVRDAVFASPGLFGSIFPFPICYMVLFQQLLSMFQSIRGNVNRFTSGRMTSLVYVVLFVKFV